MTAATAITIFHPPADSERFDAWMSDYLESARAADGFAGCRVSVRSDGRLDWGVQVSFRTAELLDEWLDSPGRKALLQRGEALGNWRRTADLVMTEHEAPPAGVAAFMHSVAPGKEADFVAAQVNLAANTATFPGSEGTVVFPPDSSGEWMSVLRFRTARQLAAWMKSHQRAQALPSLRSTLTKDFSVVSHTTPFGTTVRTENGQTEMTPNWKTAMLVLMVLYPTVMLLSRFLGPVLDRWGAAPWLALWISQVVSVSMLQWPLMPAASARFRRWLDPVDGAGLRISAIGAAVVVGVYALTLVVFATMRWLQYWDYR